MKDTVNVLVVDDEPGIRELLSYELSSQGYQVMTAANGEEAVEQVKNHRFHLVISDVKMPKMDGLETLEAIKKIDPMVEVIMATGYGTIETAVNAMKMGAYDFIQKPFNLNEIFVLIEKALEKSDLKALVAVYEASKSIFNTVKLESLLPTILRLSRKILRADEISIMLINDDGKLNLVASLGNEAGETPKEARLAMGERVAGKVAQSKEPILITGPLENDPRFAGIPSLGKIKASIVYPLVIDGKVLGVLNANRTLRSEPFLASDMQSVTIFCSQIAQAVYNARLYKELEDKMVQLKNAYVQLEDTQNQLVQTEKLAAIGQLAAGVAHELNNPLTGILGFAQLLLQEEGLTPQQREDMESIYKQSQRCRQIIQNLLQFSHRKEPKKEITKTSSLMDSTLQLVQYEFSTSGIEITKSFPADAPSVYGDPSQLQQVLLNLLTNARQALEGKKDRRISLEIRSEGENVQVLVKDNGCGISKENMSKIFDPFFTTKPVGKGTGLGLSISYGIVQQHRGTIRVESEKGVGTTFTVELPIHRG